MLTCEYKKDFSHSYLILAGETDQADSYEARILLKNDIRGLLSCQIHSINSQYKFYYDITSRQSLDSVFAIREMEYGDLKNLFLMFKTAIDEMKKYLLDGADVVLDVDHIYMEPETGQIWFLYFPGYQGNVQEGMQELTEYLLNKIDHKDEKAVEFTYWLYDYVRREQFTVLKIMEYFAAGGHKTDKPHQQTAQTVLPEEMTDKEEKTDREGKADRAGKADRGIRQLLISAAVFIVVPALLEASAAIFLFACFDMTIKEVALLFGFYGVILTGGGMIVYVKHSRRAKEAGGEDEDEEEEDIPRELPQPERTETEIDSPEKEECFGETTFLGCGAIQQKLLCGKVKGKEVRIELDTFPFIIGKMKGSVNFVLQDLSVSRMHAKFCQKSGTDEIYLTDLNSTNGTCKNGVPLDMNEEVLLQPGDEIQLGKLIFTYH